MVIRATKLRLDLTEYLAPAEQRNANVTLKYLGYAAFAAGVEETAG
jgi:hypothetical protein